MMKKTLTLLSLLAATIFCTFTVSAQQPDYRPDFDFAVRQLEQNYAGFPSLVNDETRPAYEALKARLREEVMNGERPSYEAVGELFGWFGDFHLGAGIYTKPYRRPVVDYYGMMAEYAPQDVATKVTGRTFLIRCPSFEGKYAQFVADAVQAYLDSGCENLIVDIRGNGGGRDMTFRPLLRLLYDHPGMLNGVEIRVSADHAAYLRQWAKEFPEDEHKDWYIRLADSMDTSHEEFLPWTEPEVKREYDRVSPLPKRAALIIDNFVVSSGEQFVRWIQVCSDRTTIYGRDNTRGCLDFSNLRDVNMPVSTITLWVPMTRSLGLPETSVDKEGIAPDVRLTLPLPEELTDNIDPWTVYIAEELEKTK